MNRIPSPNDGLYEHPRAGEPLVNEAIRPVDDGRERMLVGNATANPFDVPDIMAKYCPHKNDKNHNGDGEFDFEWKRYEIYGQQDFSEQRFHRDQGWEPVPHSMFPGRFAAPGTPGPVIVKDMLFMWRPMRLTIQARNEEIAAAQRAMQVHRLKMAETPEGQAPRLAPTIRTSNDRIQIPDE